MSAVHPLPTPDPIKVLALELACFPPDAPYKNAHTCYVPWSLIEELRRALEAQRIDWTGIRDACNAQTMSRHGRWIAGRMQDPMNRREIKGRKSRKGVTQL